MNDSTRCTNVDVWGQRCLRESHDDGDCLFAIAPEPPVPAAPAPEATREARDWRATLSALHSWRLSAEMPPGDDAVLVTFLKMLRADVESERAAQAREIETLRADKARHAWCAEVLATVQYRKVHGVTRVTVRSSGGRAYAERDTFAEAVDAARAPEPQP